MLWFNFILGLNIICLCFGSWLCIIMSLKPKKIKFKPGIELNPNVYVVVSFLSQVIFVFLLFQLH